MVQNLWRGGGLRICCCSHVYLDMECFAFTWTAPFFAAEIWLKFRRMLQQWQNTAANVPVAPKQRTAPLGVSWSNCLKPSLVQGPPEKALRCEDQAWPVHATVACLLVHCCRVFNLRVNSGFA